MFAVVEAGGRQYRVAPGEVLRVEKLDAQKGDSVSFDRVLLVSPDEGAVRIGKPHVSGAQVTARVLGQNRDRKVMVFRYKPKKRVRVKRGHRQSYTLVKIENIQG